MDQGPHTVQCMQGCHRQRKKILQGLGQKSGNFILSQGKLTLKEMSGKIGIYQVNVISMVLFWKQRLEAATTSDIIFVFIWPVWEILFLSGNFEN